MQANDHPRQVRYPRLQVLADGVPLEGVFEARIASNNYYAPDRFSIRLMQGSATNGLDDYLKLPESTIFDIGARLEPDAEFRSLVVGQGDISVCDYISRGIRINGRDLSASLQDTPASDVFSNRTSSEIVAILAARHGLMPVVFPTVTMVGRYYHGDTSQSAYNQFNRMSTEWDLLIFLARCEGFDIFVSGNSLYFQPATPASGTSTVLHPNDLISLKLRRRLRLSGDITVTVRSWSSKGSSAVAQTALSTRLSYASAGGPLGTTPPQIYNLVRPNLSDSDAARIAQDRVDELSRHEQCIDLTMPGELELTARSNILLDGTNSDFDQIYQIDCIDRTISSSSGFVQHISAHSISTRQTILLAGT